MTVAFGIAMPFPGAFLLQSILADIIRKIMRSQFILKFLLFRRLILNSSTDDSLNH